MSSIALELLRNNLIELNLGFISSYIDTFLHEKSSIIITTNKTFGQWGELMGDNAIATATLDRLLHHADVVIMKGESYRIKKHSRLGLIPQAMLSSDNENRK